MIRVVCPACGAKINAKETLAGQTRKCPQCGGPLRIPELTSLPTESGDAPAADAASDADLEQPLAEAVAAHVETPHEEPVEAPPHLERLHRRHRYLVLSPAQLIAAWENDGHSWMLKTAGGLVSAARNRDKLLPEGDFKLVELKLDTIAQGLRLTGLTVYQLARRWALNNLAKGDYAILSAVTGPAGLKRDQKNVVRQVLREHFMGEVWHGASRVLEYLASADTRSHSVDELPPAE